MKREGDAQEIPMEPLPPEHFQPIAEGEAADQDDKEGEEESQSEGIIPPLRHPFLLSGKNGNEKHISLAASFGDGSEQCPGCAAMPEQNDNFKMESTTDGFSLGQA